MGNDKVYLIIIFLLSFLAVVVVFIITLIQIPKIYRFVFKASFLILCIGYVIWVLSNFVFRVSDDIKVLYVSNALANLGILLFIYALYVITRVIGIKTSAWKLIKKDPYIIFASILIPLLTLLGIFTNFIDREIILSPDGQKVINPNFGKYILFMIVILGALLSIYQVVSKIKSLENKLIIFRLKVLVNSILVALLFGVFFVIILPIVFNNYNWVLLGPISTLIVLVALSLMVLDHRYYDIKNLSFYLVLALVVSLLVAIPISFFVWWFGNVILDYIPSIIILWTFVITFLLAITRFDSILGRFLGMDDLEKIVKSYLLLQNEIKSNDELAKSYTDYIKQVLGCELVELIFTNNWNSSNTPSKKYLNYLNLLFDNDNDVEQYVFFEEDIKQYYGLNSDVLKYKILKSLYKDHKIWVIQKIHYMHDVIGYLLLGPRYKHTDEFYNYQDLLLISEISQAFASRYNQLYIFIQTKNLNRILKQKVAEATYKLEQQNKLIKQKYQQEKDMIGIMGHELRTPMTIAKASAELLLQKLKLGSTIDNSYLEEKLNKIYKSILKESDLIQTLLSTSHIDNSKVNLQPEDVDIMELINDALEAYKNDIENKKLYSKVENHLTNSILFNDPQRLQEIVNNLISNAIKYTFEGGITIILKENNDFVYFSVKDTGVGIPKEEIPKIGTRFHRVHQHLDEKGNVVRSGGTGLGIYVVKGLLKVMGGELMIESEVGKGSVFTAKIPRAIKLENILDSQLERKENIIPSNFVVG